MGEEKELSYEELVEAILRNPENYKMCEGCKSVLEREELMCPHCKAYRFDEDREKVREQAIFVMVPGNK